MGSRVESLMYLPREIWQSNVFSSLSLQDICRLDSAVLNKCTRSSLLSALTGAEVQHEVILTPDIISWVMSRKFILLRVKLIEDVTTEDLLRFTSYNPQLQSLNTWDFDDDAEAMHFKYGADRNSESSESTASSDIRDMMSVDSGCRRLDELTLITILQHCPHLRCLCVHEMSITEWCEIFVRNISLFAQLEEVNFQDTHYGDDHFQFFCLNRSSFKVDADEAVLNTPLLTSIATHYPTLSSVEMGSTMVHHDIDAGLLALARQCTALNRVVLRVEVTGDTLLAMCRLRPNLIELQITSFFDVEHQLIVQEVLRLLPSLQVFFCYTFTWGNHDPLFHTLADCCSNLQVLRVTQIDCMSEHCWEDILRKCTKLRTVQCEERYMEVDAELLVEHGIAVEYTPRRWMD